MAASASFMYIASPQHYHVQNCPQHAKILHQRRATLLHCSEKKSSIRHFTSCRSMYEAGAEPEEGSGKWVSERESWRSLKDQIEAFGGEFPMGPAASSLQALVDKLDPVADPAIAHMQILLGRAKRLLRCPRSSLAHYLNAVRGAADSGLPRLGAWYLETGLACQEAGDLEGGLHFCSKAFESSMQHFGPGSLQVAQARSALTKVYLSLARYNDCIGQGQMARPILKESGTLPEVISLELTMADALFAFKRYDEIVSILKEVIDSTSGLVHINASIKSARAYAAMGKHADAKALCQAAFDRLSIQEASSEAASLHVMLASIYEEQGDFQEAALVLQRSLILYETFPQNNSQDFVSELEGKLGRVLLKLRNAKEALPHLERSLSKKRNKAGYPSKEKSREARELLHAQYYLGAAYSQCAKFTEALEQFEACIWMLSDVCKEENPSFVMTVLNNAACMHYQLERLDRAIKCQQAAVDVVKANKLQETLAAKRVEALLTKYLKEANS